MGPFGLAENEEKYLPDRRNSKWSHGIKKSRFGELRGGPRGRTEGHGVCGGKRASNTMGGFNCPSKESEPFPVHSEESVLSLRRK